MIPPADLQAMLTTRAEHPQRAVIEAVLLRAALDRLDDFVSLLELHIITDHANNPGAIVVAETVQAIQARIRREIRNVDAALATERTTP